jgi:hypothetical protein
MRGNDNNGVNNIKVLAQSVLTLLCNEGANIQDKAIIEIQNHKQHHINDDAE